MVGLASPSLSLRSLLANNPPTKVFQRRAAFGKSKYVKCSLPTRRVPLHISETGHGDVLILQQAKKQLYVLAEG